ncbi:MAG: LPXTG cell wall anchor domain-containing protein [Acidobacteria bacterium]|nr:LPXTG cell wall anchor domain-containing protein [Acidobacteriota bacterium]
MDQILPDQTFWTIILSIAAAIVLVLYILRRRKRTRGQ